MIPIFYKKLTETAVEPRKAHSSDAGWDLTVDSIKERNGVYFVGSGIAIQMPPGIWADIRSRSSVYKSGLIMSNGLGTIDRDYTGELKSVFYRIGPGRIYDKGERYAQLVFHGAEPEEIEFVNVSQFITTERGDDGFGSSGV